MQDKRQHGDVQYELTEYIQSPDKVVCFIDDDIIPHSWYNIDDNNRYIYVRRLEDLSNLVTYKIVPIEINNHTFEYLTESIQEALNTAFDDNVFTVSYDERKLTVSVNSAENRDIKVFIDEELQGLRSWSGDSYNPSNLMSVNEVIGNYKTQQ